MYCRDHTNNFKYAIFLTCHRIIYIKMILVMILARASLLLYRKGASAKGEVRSTTVYSDLLEVYLGDEVWSLGVL